jgi:hypothetical protein
MFVQYILNDTTSDLKNEFAALRNAGARPGPDIPDLSLPKGQLLFVTEVQAHILSIVHQGLGGEGHRGHMAGPPPPPPALHPWAGLCAPSWSLSSWGPYPPS